MSGNLATASLAREEIYHSKHQNLSIWVIIPLNKEDLANNVVLGDINARVAFTYEANELLDALGLDEDEIINMKMDMNEKK